VPPIWQLYGAIQAAELFDLTNMCGIREGTTKSFAQGQSASGLLDGGEIRLKARAFPHRNSAS
jgi:hypothetical protein